HPAHPHIWTLPRQIPETLQTDFHQRLATEISNDLSKSLPARYYAGLESRIVYSPPGNGGLRVVFPDVAVQEEAAVPMADMPVLGTTTATIREAPLEVALKMELPTKAFTILIKSVDGDRLVTNIKLLSPANKLSGTDDYRAYQRKRRTLLQSNSHLLEIDLTRRGKRKHLAVDLPKTPYLILLSRSYRRPRAEAWPIQLADPLPSIPIPLLRPDPDVPLDLQAILTQIYTQARYHLRIDYRQPPPPPAFSKQEMAFLEKRLGRVR
ncbi:MAG: DUF4058 family protein, partial [Anaerolineales bacterium]